MFGNLAWILVVLLALCGCTRKATYILNVDFKPANDHERALAEEKRRGLEDGLAPGALRRFFLGPRIEIVDLTVEHAEELHRLLKEKEGVIAGCVAPLATERVLAVQPILEATGVLCVAPVATGIRLKNSPGIFTLSPDDRELGRALGKFATERLGARRIAVLSVSTSASNDAETAKGFVEGASTAAVSESVLDGRLDPVEKFRIVTALVEKSWDVIFVSSYYVDALSMVEEISLAAPKGLTIIGLESWNNATFLEELSPLGTRVLIPQVFRREGVAESVVRVAAHESVRLIMRTEGRVAEARIHDGISGQLSCDGKNCLGVLGIYEASGGKLVPFAAVPLR